MKKSNHQSGKKRNPPPKLYVIMGDNDARTLGGPIPYTQFLQREQVNISNTAWLSPEKLYNYYLEGANGYKHNPPPPSVIPPPPPPLVAAPIQPPKSPSTSSGDTRTEVRSPTSTSTEVRSPTSTETSTSTSTEATTTGNVTVTGGAGAGATNVYIYDKSAMYAPTRSGERDEVEPTPPPSRLREERVKFDVGNSSDRDKRNPNKGRTLLLPLTPSKRNPDFTAADMYEIFHGTPSTEVLEFTTDVHFHEHLSALGDLQELVIHTPTKKEAVLSFDSEQPKLCSNESGTQLYIEGGDQSIELSGIKMDGDKWVKDSMVLGTLVELTYRTKKGFDKFKLIDYYHGLGEESGNQPQLLYDSVNHLLSVSGGNYNVEDRGIVD